jgi:TIR domain
MEGVGATTFRDDGDFRGGDDIPEEIFRQIRQSQEFLVLLTPASVNRPWVLLEVGAACGCDPPPRIVAVRYYVETDSIPSLIKSKKGFHLNELDIYLDEVASRCRGPT